MMGTATFRRQGGQAAGNFTYDGQRVIETRSGGQRLLKQEVWGLAYVDELVQVGINQDPEDTDETNGGACERFFWALQDANYNVLGLVSQTGLLVERYEYTPYGRRTVFSRNWLIADLNGDGAVDAGDQALYSAANTEDPNDPADLNGNGTVCDVGDQAVFSASYGDSYAVNDALVSYPTRDSCGGRWAAGGGTDVLTIGTCDIGHQGLFFDKEFGCYDNDARVYHPFLGRFLQRDPLGHVDRLNMYQYVSSDPIGFADPSGLLKCPTVVTGEKAITGHTSISDHALQELAKSLIPAGSMYIPSIKVKAVGYECYRTYEQIGPCFILFRKHTCRYNCKVTGYEVEVTLYFVLHGQKVMDNKWFPLHIQAGGLPMLPVELSELELCCFWQINERVDEYEYVQEYIDKKLEEGTELPIAPGERPNTQWRGRVQIPMPE